MLIYLQMVETEEERDLIELFYKEYRTKMLRVALSILHNQQDAEEAVHQAFLRICNNTSLLPKEICHKTEGFFVIIVKNISIDLYRRKKIVQEVEFDEDYIGATTEDVVESEALSRVSEEKLADIIAKLPSKYSESLILKYHYGYMNKECAKLLGITPETFRKHLERARTMLASECVREGIMNEA
ncbi:MAG: polymerase, sigma-24 subunit, subfamily [Herbinix sp.]|jgi:RNA polymerase sigma-70 factor (ECF subfamily)|nr:polymerase, sigma-24 subunit, subfamily [Herbinix sp.]